MNHVFIVTTSFPDAAFQPGQEAAGAFVADFAEALSRQVHVTVVAPSSRDDEEQGERLSIRRFAVPKLPLSLLDPINPAHWPAIIKTLRAGQAALNSAVSQAPPDHIFALWALPSGYWANQVRRHRGIPYSTWALGSDIWTLGRVPLVKNMLRNVLRASRLRFADGVRLTNDVKAISGMDCWFLPSSRTLPARPAKRLAAQPPYRLAFLGRWHPNKGIDLLLESLGRLTGDDWHRIESVRICGGGPLEGLVRERCATLEHAGRPVKMMGYLNKQEATALMGWADYVMLPSRIESIPVVFSDAMQGGCPIVCSPVGDLPHLIDKYKIGQVAREVGADAFAEALRHILLRSPASYEPGLHVAAHDFSVETAAAAFLQRITG